MQDRKSQASQYLARTVALLAQADEVAGGGAQCPLDPAGAKVGVKALLDHVAARWVPSHLRRSITFDQGSEWAQWPTLVDGYGLKAWFCDPHSPWQRGQVENLNRQWRWWYPRGTDLAAISPAEANAVAAIIDRLRNRA